MGLSKLGNYIELIDKRNSDLKFKTSDVKCISTSKCFIETKAGLDNVSLHNYKIVEINQFAYVADTSRRGEKIGLAFADKSACIISSIYNVFKIKDNVDLLPRYLMMYFNRSEFDRYARFNSWGSARETFSWEDFCDIELEVPSIDIQKKYVAIYEGLLANLHSYEKGLEDLKLVCDGYIENLRKSHNVETIGKYIVDTCTKNKDYNLLIAGISNTQKLIPSESRTSGVDKLKYYLLMNNEFAYSPIHINDGSIAFNSTNNDYIVSPIYRTFKTINDDIVYSKYLMLWFGRSEFIRYCKFYAFGSARDSFDWSQMKEVKIPIPTVEIQKSISKVYDVLNYRKNNLEKLKEKIKNICPILIRGSIEEANRR